MSGDKQEDFERTNDLRLPGHVFKSASSRRSFLSAGVKGAGLTALAASISAPAQAETLSSLRPSELGDGGHLRYHHLQFDSAEEAMRTKLRLEFGLGDNTYLWWYTFVLFAVTPDRSPVRLLRFEGIEMSEWRRSGPDEYIVHGHNLSFPTDDDTGAYISEWENPFTGETVTAIPTVLTSDPGRRKTPHGDYDLANEASGLRPDVAIVRVEGDLIHKDGVRMPPENWPGQFVETNCVTGSVKELIYGDADSIEARGSGMWIQPFLKWMNMPADSGHMTGYFSGRKLSSVEALPKPFYDRLTTEYPELARVDPTKFSGEYWDRNKSGLLNVD